MFAFLQSRRATRLVVVGAMSLMTCWAASAQPASPLAADGLSLEETPLPRLEAIYRACDDLIANEMPTPDQLEYCSLVYETLKKRRFGGSTERFVQWLREQPKPAHRKGGRPVTTLHPAGPPADDTYELERVFWACDYTATRVMLDFDTAVRCSRATEELRRQRFDDDFRAMLTWWRERKAAEHAALDAVAPAGATKPATGL